MYRFLGEKMSGKSGKFPYFLVGFFRQPLLFFHKKSFQGCFVLVYVLSMFGKGSINLNMNMFYTQYSSLESLWSNFSRLNGPFLHGFIKEFPSLSFLSRMPRKCWYWKIVPTNNIRWWWWCKQWLNTQCDKLWQAELQTESSRRSSMNNKKNSIITSALITNICMQ